jgi:ATP-dependent Lon protease
VEIPDNIKAKLEIIPVRWIDQVLEVALAHQPTPLPKGSAAAGDPPKPKAKDKKSSGVRAH